MRQSRQGGFLKRQPGQQRTVRQLFLLVFVWTLVCVGGLGALGTLLLAVRGEPMMARSVAVAAGAILLSSAVSAVIAALEALPGLVSGLLRYLATILLVVGCMVWGRHNEALDVLALGVALIALEIVSLVTMTLVVLKCQGPGLDFSERDPVEN